MARKPKPTAIDFDALAADAKRVEGMSGDDIDRELSLEALKGDAIRTLFEALNASSEDVRRKAASDILNFNKATREAAPLVTEEQLEYLGRIIVETEEIRLGSVGREGSTRLLESPSTH